MRLRLMDPLAFVALCNDLLAHTAMRGGIEVSCLDLSLHIADPDGGVDARCTGAPHVVGRLIPAPDVAYQFKGGSTSRSAANIAKHDVLQKPRVMEALKAGQPLVYIAAAKYGVDIARRIRASLAAGGKNVAKTRQGKGGKRKSKPAKKSSGPKGIKIRQDQFDLINADTLAQTLIAFPSVIARFLKLGPLLDITDWERLQPMTNRFATDAAVDGRIRGLRSQIEGEHSNTRVLGPGGVGKTRLILEALKASIVTGEVLYAASPDHAPPDLWDHLRLTPTAKCAVVVDEVNEVEAGRLGALFALMPSGVRLVTIGRDATRVDSRAVRSTPGTERIEGPSEDVIVRAIEGVAPGLPEGVARDIATTCEHSPKLAILLASRAQHDPALAESYNRLRDPEIQGVLNKFLPLQADDVLALSAVALVDQVGWTGDVDTEATTLFQLLGRDPIEARDRVNRLDQEYAVAPQVGKYRYVSPDILADHLAARLLNAMDGNAFRELFEGLPANLARGLAMRIRRLTGVLANRNSVEEVILGDQGPFQNLGELEIGRLSTLLPALAGAFQRASLRALTRVIGSAPDSELQASTGSRRHLVSALTELLWPESTFEEAAMLLLRLATNENEEYANNATGVFVETFQTRLGRTAAGPAIRARILQRAAESESPRERIVAAKAIEAALKTGHISRMGMPPRDVPGMPEREWRPQTWGEWWEAVEVYLGILTPLLTDPDAEVRAAAVDALAEGTSLAYDVTRIADAWSAAARRIVDGDFDDRAKVINALQLDLDRLRMRAPPTDLTEVQMAEHSRNEEERIAKLTAVRDELAGTDFSSRFRGAVSRNLWSSLSESLDERSREIRAGLESIAGEVVKDPNALDGEWAWLLADKTNQAEEFSMILGRIDADRRYADKLVALARDNRRAVVWVSLYEIGYGEARGDASHVDRIAADLARDPKDSGQLFDLLLRAGYTPERATTAIGLFGARLIPGNSIGSLAYSSWRTGLSAEEALALASAAAEDESAVGAVVAFVGHFVQGSAPAARATMKNVALKILASPRPGEERRGFDWEWEELAKAYVAEAPLEVGAAALADLAERKHAHAQGFDSLMRLAWEAAPDKQLFFETVLAPWIHAETSGGWWVRQGLEHFPLGDLDVDFLLGWVAAKPGPRAQNLADVLGKPIGRVSDLHAALLEKYADKGVGDAFFGSMISGTWTGPAAPWSMGRLAEAEKYLRDERPAVREWARRAVAALKEMVEANAVRDAEEELRRR